MFSPHSGYMSACWRRNYKGWLMKEPITYCKGCQVFYNNVFWPVTESKLQPHIYNLFTLSPPGASYWKPNSQKSYKSLCHMKRHTCYGVMWTWFNMDFIWPFPLDTLVLTVVEHYRQNHLFLRSICCWAQGPWLQIKNLTANNSR